MEHYNHINYMLDCATRLKEIGHTTETPKFFRVSSIGHLDELLSNLNKIEFPALMVDDNTDGTVGDRNKSDNYVDSPLFNFYIVKHVELEDHDARQTAKTDCKNIGFKILSKMARDKRKLLNGLTWLEFTNLPYQTIGPIGDNCFGVMFSFTVSNNANLFYNANDWING